jgi:hypothetical protein
MAKKLPKIIFVVKREDEDGILIADTGTVGFDDGEVVGVYELKSTKHKRVTHSLEVGR